MQDHSPPAAIRPAAVAGMFYPADAGQMQRELASLFPAAPVETRPWRAAMAPHAGWAYSGRIAADVFRRIQIPPTVIILCPKHRPGGAQWAAAPHQAWAIPGGTVAADTELTHRLVESIDGLELDPTPHRQEHAIEVQLPILAHLAPQVRIVGITIGLADPQDGVRFAEAMAGVLKEQGDSVLLLISSDMNHFATDAENRRLDRLALAELQRLDPLALYQQCRTNNISMCGLMPAFIVLETLRRLDALHRGECVAYATSADAGGDTNRVVGYAGMLFD